MAEGAPATTGEPRADDEAPEVSARAGLLADAARLAGMIEAIADTGRDPDSGITRLAFTPPERAAHDLVSGWLTELGLGVSHDAIGNTIAELPGDRTDLGAIAIGSHLDSVPHGGQFDGIAGVVAAVETTRLLVDAGIRLQHPLRVVVFAGEEGARFNEPCVGSKAVVGNWDASNLERLVDADGVTVAQAMGSVGLDPHRVEDARWRRQDWAAFLELHVEQSTVLESAGLQIGLVDLVSGSTRVRFEVRGRATHTGGTPMHLRADALAAAAEVTLFAERLAHDPRYRGTRATVGRLDVHPNSITTIAGRTTFILDVRDTDSDRQRRAAEEIAQAAGEICARRGVGLRYEVVADSSPVVLPMWLREVVTAACEDLAVPYRVMSSGAGHDAQIVNRVTPSGMIFVPSKDGISHAPGEWTSATDLAAGATVLTQSVLRLDRFLLGLVRADQLAAGAAAGES